ncbi:oxidoreductase [Aeromicrobium sp. Root236]|uniref:SDR family NAD(P)-dependent oxidoreductase n=1 Tax=Aeromicrobium sp. Root236 TaxID=1736498 RepID=UPI0006FB4DC5|nr:SDR family oxidoreductase [Aeromicrobium sp. Root236]KRC65046.1 oxidoreductase [Aeromicrobium sp. Root236]
MTTIVTGGTRGIGAAITRALASDGHDVVASYVRDDASAEALAAELEAVHVVRADVTTTDGIDTLFNAAQERGPVTGLVNNAGATMHVGPLAETDPEVIRSVIDLNLTAAVLCARRAVQAMTAGGTIVNISSGAATLGSPGEYVHYAAAKAGVDALTVGLGKEVASLGIRVVGVAPGTIRTGIHADAGDPGRPDRVAERVPLGRAGEPDDIAGAVAWLFRPEAAYVTATTIRITGGM